MTVAELKERERKRYAIPPAFRSRIPDASEGDIDNTPITCLLGLALPSFLHLPRGQIGYEFKSGGREIRIWTKAGAPVHYATTLRCHPRRGLVSEIPKEI